MTIQERCNAIAAALGLPKPTLICSYAYINAVDDVCLYRSSGCGVEQNVKIVDHVVGPLARTECKS